MQPTKAIHLLVAQTMSRTQLVNDSSSTGKVLQCNDEGPFSLLECSYENDCILICALQYASLESIYECFTPCRFFTKVERMRSVGYNREKFASLTF